MDLPSVAISYWMSLIELCTHPKTAVENVDVPLPDAAAKAKWASGWTVLLIWATFLAVHRSDLPQTVNHLFNVSLPGSAAWLLFLSCGVAAVPLAYGFLRLYTLVTHVLTLNVFKVRGQRLRLLNLETKLLALCVFICIGFTLESISVPIGLALLAATVLFAGWIIALGYNHIFHKHGVRGLLLFVEGTLVTWFVLCIGALAVSVMAAVLAFFVILVLRSFHPA